MLSKYVGGLVRFAEPIGTIQTLLIVSKEQDKAIELMVDGATGEVKSACEVTIKPPEPKRAPKIIRFDPNFKKKDGNR